MLHLPDTASPKPFVVLALPRSRTRWLSEFLTYGPWKCGHESGRYLRSMEDVKSWSTVPFCGSVETAIAPFWRTIPKGARIVVVRRPIQEVEKSLMKVMTEVPETLAQTLRYLDAKLSQVERRVDGVVSVGWEELGTPEGARKVFEHALQLPFDYAWWSVLKDVNIQEPFVVYERYVKAYCVQLQRMAGLAKGVALRDLAVARREAPEGFVFALEPLRTFLRDSVGLFAEHAQVLGTLPDAWRSLNLGFLQDIEDQCILQILTARSNGKMYGYLLTEVTASRDSAAKLSAVETSFYASPDAPGLGMKLQRENLKLLRERGVAEVWLRAGTEGDGSRLGVMYRRVGAVPAGSLWKLDLGAV